MTRCPFKTCQVFLHTQHIIVSYIVIANIIAIRWLSLVHAEFSPSFAWPWKHKTFCHLLLCIRMCCFSIVEKTLAVSQHHSGAKPDCLSVFFFVWPSFCSWAAATAAGGGSFTSCSCWTGRAIPRAGLPLHHTHITPLRAVIVEIQQFKKYPNNVLLEGEKLPVLLMARYKSASNRIGYCMKLACHLKHHKTS